MTIHVVGRISILIYMCVCVCIHTHTLTDILFLRTFEFDPTLFGERVLADVIKLWILKCGPYILAGLLVRERFEI